MRRLIAPIALSFLFSAACSQMDNFDPNQKDMLGQSDYNEDDDEKTDGIRGRRGPSTAFDNGATQVWKVRRDWADKDPKAGMAWSANSNLSWDDKYSAWVASMEKMDETFKLTTPFGTSFKSPNLECAEVALFLRITFASWYELPFFLEATTGNGTRVFFGHMGIITSNGASWKGHANYSKYPDYSDQKAQVIANPENWPNDTTLRKKKISGTADDSQDAFDGAHAGTYFDEIFLNKRVGYFMTNQMTWTGSVTLADPANSYHVKATAMTTGDYLLRRYPDRSRSGHTVILKNVILHDSTVDIDGQQVQQRELRTMSGNMPRRTALWEDSASSRRRFMGNDFGGSEAYAKEGAGLNRFRSAVSVGGKWTNTILPEDSDDWLNSKDIAKLIGRKKIYDRILIILDPQDRLDSLAKSVELEREWLRDHPSSCAARTRREESFQEIYKAGAELSKSKEEMDAAYRNLEDYVFAELDYDVSKTCCWNNSNNDTYRAVMKYNECLLGEATGAECDALTEPDKGICQPARIFMNRDDGGNGYEIFKDFALANGYSWTAWDNSENCTWGKVSEDTAKPEAAVPYCELASRVKPDGCRVDQFSCGGGVCIKEKWACDGESDCDCPPDKPGCVNALDEANCN